MEKVTFAGDVVSDLAVRLAAGAQLQLGHAAAGCDWTVSIVTVLAASAKARVTQLDLQSRIPRSNFNVAAPALL